MLGRESIENGNDLYPGKICEALEATIDIGSRASSASGEWANRRELFRALAKPFAAS